jgi:hypothetical protein
LGEKANEANAAIDAKMVPAAPVEPTKERWTVLLPDKEDFSKILIEAGMPAGLARRVSRSIAVALAAGLMIVISGTASSMIARRLARALADIGVASAPIVIGAVEPVFSVSDIKVADRDWDVVALESFDLAPIESYGQEILNAVAEQIVGRAVLVTHVFCSGTDGISALPLSASVRKLCYAVDLDKRAYGETDETLDDWHSRMADESEDVQKDVRPWNVVLKRVLKALGEVPKDESTALLPIIEYGLCGKLVM